jgi:hypothetical protein
MPVEYIIPTLLRDIIPMLLRDIIPVGGRLLRSFVEKPFYSS